MARFGPVRRPPVSRFAEKIALTDSGCVEWIASTDSKGYGKFQWEGGRNGRLMPAHRWAYEWVVGPIPDGLQLDHLCRNRRCVNPEHLEPVTQRVNVLRGVGPAALNAGKTHCYRGTRWSATTSTSTPGQAVGSAGPVGAIPIAKRWLDVLDMTESIAPRSDQMNAEDLLSGPRTFTIREVSKGASAEQPIDVHLVEFPDGRPFKPSKTVRRIMVAAWGPDASIYAGRRMTLYRDPAVKFGGMDVGGIRVSHMSHLDKPLSIALAVTKGKRAMYVVKPLPADEPKPTGDGITAEELKELAAGFAALGITDRDAGLAAISQVIDREVTSSKELTRAEASRVLEWIEFEQQQDAEPTLDGAS